MSRWRKVTKDKPCPVCGKSDWCAWSSEGDVLRCMRGGRTPDGMRHWRDDRNGGVLFKQDSHDHATRHRPVVKPTATSSATDWPVMMGSLRAKLTDERLAELAQATSLPVAAWAQLSPGWADADDLKTLRAGGEGWADDRPTGAWAFAEHRGDGRVVGAGLRTTDGRKGAPASSTGARRGLVVPANLHDLPDPVLCVEGASDVAACAALGLTAVGRPSNRAGADDLADLLDGRDVLVVGERDGGLAGQGRREGRCGEAGGGVG